jgi:DNA (cytosine-5)-methyltransferase 1
MEKEIGVLDLFCGAGGLSEGFKQAGFKILLGIDSDNAALETFRENHPGTGIISGDIREIERDDVARETSDKKIDVIIGGPPCQGFSMAGKRQPNDPRNSLFREYLRLVKEIRPKVFVMENVRGLLSMKNASGRRVIDIILGEFGKLKDYNTICYSVNAAEYGVPQMRKRIFVIGVKKSLNFEFPKPKYGPSLQEPAGKILLDKKEVNKKYFYSDKLIQGFLRRDKINKKKGLGFGWQFIDPEKPSYTISARYWKDGAEALVKYSDKCIRMLTPQECALIQSFPKGYIFKGSESAVYKQIGNAVPPKLAKAIGKAVMAAINSN